MQSAGADVAGTDVEPPLAFTSLPLELVMLILQATGDAVPVLACTSTCRTLAALPSNGERLWQHLCEQAWPWLATPRSVPAAHLAVFPPPSWRELHRSRVRGARLDTAGNGWRELLNLYDHSTLVATERRAGWVVELGTLLLRIERVEHRFARRASPCPDACGDVTPVGMSEAMHWGETVRQEMHRGINDVLTLAGARALAVPGLAPPTDPSARSVVDQLDEWHEMISEGAPPMSARAEEAARLLVSAFVNRSALQAAVEMELVILGDFGGRLNAAIRAIDESIRSLRQEGCDLSLTRAQRDAAVVGRAEYGNPTHWWWRLEAPCYVSGGNPFIPTI